MGISTGHLPGHSGNNKQEEGREANVSYDAWWSRRNREVVSFHPCHKEPKKRQKGLLWFLAPEVSVHHMIECVAAHIRTKQPGS